MDGNQLHSRKKSSGNNCGEKQWFAFYVKPRHEKKASDRLSESFEIWCPLKEERVKWSDRWKLVAKPYIPGYIFARVTEAERLAILEDTSVFRTVCWKGRPAAIRQEEIDTVKRIIGDPDVENLRLESISPGDRVEVTGGEFANINGVVVAVKGIRAAIRLESLKCNMTFTVKRTLVKVKI
jgi:transcription antitermination factor NusG